MLIVAADIHPAVADQRRGIDVAAGFEGPLLLAAVHIDPMHVAIVGADDGDPIGHGRG